MANPDHSWEALVRETHANPAVERGALNTALKAIREAATTEGLVMEDLPLEIRRRAEMYRQTFPGITLTPMALAKHWFRVMAPKEPRSTQQQAIDRLRQDSKP